LEYQGETRFHGKAESGATLTLDADAGKSPKPSGPSPVEAALLATAACSASDVVSILRKMRQPLEGLRVEATAERATLDPRVFVAIHLDYEVRGRVKPEAAERAIRLSLEKYCSVGVMMKPSGAKVTSAFRIVVEDL
jgi:putative redox protein